MCIGSGGLFANIRCEKKAMGLCGSYSITMFKSRGRLSSGKYEDAKIYSMTGGGQVLRVQLWF